MEKIEVGTGTVSTRLKAAYRKSCPIDTNGELAYSLKRWLRDNLKDTPDYKLWVKNKSGKNRMRRSDKSIARIQLEAQATKASRKKVKKQ